MKASERDEILGELVGFIKDPSGLIPRLDERTLNIYKEITEVKKHQAKQNGSIEECIKGVASNTAWLKAMRVGFIVFCSLLGTHLGGWW